MTQPQDGEPESALQPQPECIPEHPPRPDIERKYRPFFLALMLLPCFFLRERLDNDAWFLLSSGRYVLQHGIPHVEPFTIHAGLHFVMQQWMSACAFWLTYRQFGVPGLDALVLVCYMLTAMLVFKLCMRVSNNYFFISFAVTIVAVVGLAPSMVQRPFVFSTAILAAEVYLLEGYLQSGSRRGLFALPLLSALLINLHASMWPMQFILLLPYAADSFRFRLGFLSGQGCAKRPLLLSAAGMLAAGFLNPYGIEAMLYLRTSYGYSEINDFILEMFPPNIREPIGMMIYGIFALVLCVYCLYRKGNTRLRYVLLSLGTAYMALSSQRSFVFFAVCGTFPLAYYLRGFSFPQGAAAAPTRKILLLRRGLFGLLLVLILGYTIHSSVCGSGQAKNRYEPLQSCITFIREERPKNLVLYTGYNDGGLAEFMGLPSYIDSRADVFLQKNNGKAEIMREFYQLQKGTLYYRTFLDKYRFTHLIVARDDTLYVNLLHDTEYRIGYSNEKYAVFEKMH